MQLAQPLEYRPRGFQILGPRRAPQDDERSALARLRKELVGTIGELDRRNHEFHTEVRVTLASLQTRRDEAARSTRHGTTFEALRDVSPLLAARSGLSTRDSSMRDVATKVAAAAAAEDDT